MPAHHLLLPLPTGTLTLTLHRCNLTAVPCGSTCHLVLVELPLPRELSNWKALRNHTGTFLINFYYSSARMRAPRHAKHSAPASGLDPTQPPRTAQHRLGETRDFSLERRLGPAALALRSLLTQRLKAGLFFKYASQLSNIQRRINLRGPPPRSVFSRLRSFGSFSLGRLPEAEETADMKTPT